MAVLEGSTITKSSPAEAGPGSSYGHWIVTVYDQDDITVEAVEFILMKATKCTQEEAEIETWEVHHLGKSVVHHGSEKVCREAADVIATIGIRVEVDEE